MEWNGGGFGGMLLNNEFMKSNPPKGMCHLIYVSCFYNFFPKFWHDAICNGICAGYVLSGAYLRVDFENLIRGAQPNFLV